jgi:hypothetical protein
LNFKPKAHDRNAGVPSSLGIDAGAEGPRGPGTVAEVWGDRFRGTLLLRRQLVASTGRRSFMVILGVILIILGLVVASLHVLLIIGVILLVVGLILNLVPMGGTRRRYY